MMENVELFYKTFLSLGYVEPFQHTNEFNIW